MERIPPSARTIVTFACISILYYTFRIPPFYTPNYSIGAMAKGPALLDYCKILYVTFVGGNYSN